MEKLLLSNPSNISPCLKNCEARVRWVPISVNYSSSSRVWEVRCLSSRDCLRFEEVRLRDRVSSKLGLGTVLRHNVRAGGFRDSSSRKQISVAASGEESASADLQSEGKVAENGKDSNSVQEATTWKEEEDRDESRKLNTESFESLRNSIEELQREVDKAAESLAEVSKEVVGKVEKTSAAIASESTKEPRKGAKIHDFCLGIPYGGLLFGGSLIGFLISSNRASIIFGFLIGGAVLGLSTTSLKVWKQGKSCTPFILGQAALSFILLAKQLQEFVLTKKIFPTGFIAFISAVMLSFFSYVYAAGGNPPSKKLRSSSASQVS